MFNIDKKYLAGVGVGVVLLGICVGLYINKDTIFLPQFVELFKIYLVGVMAYAGIVSQKTKNKVEEKYIDDDGEPILFDNGK